CDYPFYGDQSYYCCLKGKTTPTLEDIVALTGLPMHGNKRYQESCIRKTMSDEEKELHDHLLTFETNSINFKIPEEIMFEDDGSEKFETSSKNKGKAILSRIVY
ncbi:hypothetical protein C5167_011106, partial [Papaver somniferum]